MAMFLRPINVYLFKNALHKYTIIYITLIYNLYNHNLYKFPF